MEWLFIGLILGIFYFIFNINNTKKLNDSKNNYNNIDLSENIIPKKKYINTIQEERLSKLRTKYKSEKTSEQLVKKNIFSYKTHVIDNSFFGIKTTEKIENINSPFIKQPPLGYEIYEDSSFFIHGVSYRKNDCIIWAKEENLTLSYKREPNNKYDSNAIIIFGNSSKGKKKLGYIASEIADELVYENLIDNMKINLIDVKIEDGFPFIEYEIWVKSANYFV